MKGQLRYIKSVPSKPNTIGQAKNEMAAKETVTTRVARLEELHSVLAEKVNILLDAQIQTEKKFQHTDERIEKLVSAIGELIRRNGTK